MIVDEKLIDFKNKQKVESAIHLLSDYSANYYHWLIEIIPRLQHIARSKSLKALPLLIDSDVPEQYLNPIKLAFKKFCNLIKINDLEALKIKHLIYPSFRSITNNHNNLLPPTKNDYLTSPKSLHYICSLYNNEILTSQNHKYEKIFIYRKQTGRRRLLNSEEIYKSFVTLGFHGIKPQDFSIIEQARLFSEANFIVGETGAALTNLCFCKPNTIVIELISSANNMNLYVFSQIAHIKKLNIYFFKGDTLLHQFLHSDFTIDQKSLRVTPESCGLGLG